MDSANHHHTSGAIFLEHSHDHQGSKPIQTTGWLIEKDEGRVGNGATALE